MVSGLELFKQHFDGYQDCFVLIGGAACDLLFTQQGLSFRSTKDLDIVLFIEVIDESFLARFWEFIRLGQYRIATKSEDIKTLYRFDKPCEPGYPAMIEIFSRSDNHNLAIPPSVSSILSISEDSSNLSAILLDDIYYHFIHKGTIMFDGFPQLNASHLIPLKVKAFLNLLSLSIKGERVKSTDLEKHFRDVFRLYELLNPSMRFTLPNVINEDMKAFIAFIRDFPISKLAYQNLQPDERILSQIEQIFSLKD